MSSEPLNTHNKRFYPTFSGVTTIDRRLPILQSTVINESTAGADASVEMPKLHNIKLLIA